MEGIDEYFGFCGRWLMWWKRKERNLFPECDMTGNPQFLGMWIITARPFLLSTVSNKNTDKRSLREFVLFSFRE